MAKKKVFLDLSQLYTGYHRLLQAVFGIHEIYYRVDSADDYIAIVQEGLLPVPLAKEAVTQISDVLATLTEREREIVKRRFGLEDFERQTLEMIGKEFNISRERVRGIEARAISKLRHPLRSERLKHIPIRWADIQKKMLELQSQCEKLQADLDSLIKASNDAMRCYHQAAEVFRPLFEEEKKRRIDTVLDQRIGDFELSVRATNCLEAAEIRTVRDLVIRTESEMLRIRNLGRKALNEIKETILNPKGLSFGMILEE